LWYRNAARLHTLKRNEYCNAQAALELPMKHIYYILVSFWVLGSAYEMRHQHLMYHYQLLHTVFFIHYTRTISSVLVFTHCSLWQKKRYIVNRGPLAISTCLLFLPPSARCTFLKRCNTNPCNTCWPYHSLNTKISVLSAPATQCRLDVDLDPERAGQTTSNYEETQIS
jgi:hypothetical protein